MAGHCTKYCFGDKEPERKQQEPAKTEAETEQPQTPVWNDEEVGLDDQPRA